VYDRAARFYDAIYGYKDYRAEAAYVEALIRRHQRSAGRALLDVACGTGRHLEHLRQRYACEGLDLSGEMLAVARARLPGLPLHQGDMAAFDLGRRFDAVVCMFSSIGYVQTEDRLGSAAIAMARHLEPGGVLVVEPWLSPDVWQEGHVAAVHVDEPELKVARMNVAERRGDLSVVDFHYLVATPEGVEHFTELHELGLFTVEQYLAAFRRAGLDVEHDPEGPMGRGLFVATRSR